MSVDNNNLPEYHEEWGRIRLTLEFVRLIGLIVFRKIVNICLRIQKLSLKTEIWVLRGLVGIKEIING